LPSHKQRPLFFASDEPRVIPYSTCSFDHRGNGEQKWAAPGPGARSAAFFFLLSGAVALTFRRPRYCSQANYGQHKHKDVEHLFAFIVRTATVRADSPLRLAATPQASGLKAPNTDEEAPR